ncbi:hypothetical protein SARC_18147 [Sphaeroforma arctica JP610]|uniref:Uncharacterized protein n=1 Tax=Sphaeroforma arctica JP610 TaxID=667725 RepID=A0A0L0EZR3_9EUKA|nr:hypothetical protein SARC_18147 [Sphaeroforma arctica JP610]KNC69343.1 hypothetical protein SARC_18147 [Sphaeroforma arctica JP610]|eukprot:XP_014143245.1 hypothetical protein SARC_18147 [Sphaeroforma arctica JP610]
MPTHLKHSKQEFLSQPQPKLLPQKRKDKQKDAETVATNQAFLMHPKILQRLVTTVTLRSQNMHTLPHSATTRRVSNAMEEDFGQAMSFASMFSMLNLQRYPEALNSYDE